MAANPAVASVAPHATSPNTTSGSVARGRAAREQTVVLVVLSLLVALTAGGAVLGALRVSDSMRLGRSRAGLQTSLATVFEKQGTFRRTNARFATWEEMVADGMRLPDGQRVRRSSAGPSHWYLSLRDERTGVICDRVGELFDDPDDRPPRCRDRDRDREPGNGLRDD